MSTLVESFIVPKSSVFRREAVEALHRLHERVPYGAALVTLPANLGSEYRKEIHLYRDRKGYEQPMEIAIREEKGADGQVIYEYSTDYEL